MASFDLHDGAVRHQRIVTSFWLPPFGYVQYPPGGHVVLLLTAGDQIRPSGAAYTDAERAAIHKSIMTALSGTYTIDGTKLVIRIVSSSRPEWVGNDQIRYFEIDGRKLTIKTAPTMNTNGQQVVGILTFDRVE
jgi:hypothetical protein